MISLRHVAGKNPAYERIIGTGGIGSGILFSLRGNHTLGRNESRLATLLPCRDFCKQHIILHYLAVLLGAKAGNVEVFPIGKIGNDAAGKELIRMMDDAGMNITYVSVCNELPTLFSACYQYPDNTGGNITTENSASSLVSAATINGFFTREKLQTKKEIIVAVPEVPLDARIELLQRGRERKSLNVASVLSSEVTEFKNKHGFSLVDILAINIDEAANIAGIPYEAVESKDIVNACIQTVVQTNPGICVLITDGSLGSYCYHHNHLEFTPVLNVKVSSTAGAGDAFLAGTLAGLCCGLPMVKGASDPIFSATPIATATELGTLLASLSVTSPDTIHPTADAYTVYQFAEANGVRFSKKFLKIFRDCNGENNYGD